MVMAMLDQTTAESGLNPEVRLSILDQVIDAVNREFPGTTLRAPEEPERLQVNTRVRALVAASFRAAALPPNGLGPTPIKRPLWPVAGPGRTWLKALRNSSQ